MGGPKHGLYVASLGDQWDTMTRRNHGRPRRLCRYEWIGGIWLYRGTWEDMRREEVAR